MFLSSPISTPVTSKPVCLYPSLCLLQSTSNLYVSTLPYIYSLQWTLNLSVSTLPLYLLQWTPNLSVSSLPYIYSSELQTCLHLPSRISYTVNSKPVCLYPPLYLLQWTPNLSVSTLLYVYSIQHQTCLSLPSLISTSINYIFSLANNGNVWSTTRQEALQFCARPATNQAGGRGRIGGAVGGW